MVSNMHSHRSMGRACLPSRYQILVAILIVITLQLILWVTMLFGPSRSRVTIYLDGLDLERNQLEFQNARLVTKETGSQERVLGHDRTRGRGSQNDRKHKKGGILARLDVIKQEKMVQQSSDTQKGQGNIARNKRNESNPMLRERAALLALPWTEDTRQRLLANLEPSLFTADMAPASDGSCSVVEVAAPRGLCSQSRLDWECRHSPTFTVHNRLDRTLTVSCPGDFKVEWYFERNGGLTNDVMKNYTNQYSDWSHVTGPITIPFPTQYADVMCRVKTGNRSDIHHNYRTQFIPNKEAIAAQKKIFEELKLQNPDWNPLSVLSINVDSLSRAQFHRSCGLPKTRQLLKKLFNTGGDSGHQAFLFNRLNAIGGVTAMNLTPLYAGIFFKRADEERRVLLHRYTKPIKEWVWDYANEHGFLTSYAIDTGNGLMGTGTICPTCNHLPVELPHWEHGWVKMENQEVRPGVLSGLCDGDTMIHEHIMNFTRDLLHLDFPAKWAAFDLNAKHRPEQESASQVDALLADTLHTLMNRQPNLAIFLFGDHGDRYHGDDANHPGSYMEIMLPFFALVLPRHILDSHPEWERTLLINSQRYVVHYDLHHTMKSLMEYPHLDQVKGHTFKDSYNLITRIIPRERACSEAKIPSWSCACGGPTYLKSSEWTDLHVYYAQIALNEINSRHSKEVLTKDSVTAGTFRTSCMDLHLDSLVAVARIHHDYAGLRVGVYMITFSAREGPSHWELHVTDDGVVESLKQVSRYQKYEDCVDPRVSIEFCVCKQFPPDTP